MSTSSDRFGCGMNYLSCRGRSALLLILMKQNLFLTNLVFKGISSFNLEGSLSSVYETNVTKTRGDFFGSLSSLVSCDMRRLFLFSTCVALSAQRSIFITVTLQPSSSINTSPSSLCPPLLLQTP